MRSASGWKRHNYVRSRGVTDPRRPGIGRASVAFGHRVARSSADGVSQVRSRYDPEFIAYLRYRACSSFPVREGRRSALRVPGTPLVLGSAEEVDGEARMVAVFQYDADEEFWLIGENDY